MLKNLLLAVLCLASAGLVEASPYVKLANGPHRRMLRRSARQQDHSKRYVIVPNDKSTGRTLNTEDFDASLLRRSPESTFQHSNLTTKLKRATDGSREGVEKGELHPLIYWTQHYNRALARRAAVVSHGNVNKRDQVTRDLRTEAEERLRKRWASLFEEGEAPALKKVKRNRLEPLIKDSNIFGLNRGMAADLGSDSDLDNEFKAGSGKGRQAATDRDAASSGGQSTGFSKASLDAALKGTISKPTGDLADDSIGMFIEANDVGYFATMQIGTPAKPFRVLMDSGSADFWVPSQSCNSDGTCGNHRTLGTASSSSFKVSSPQRSFQVTYGTGSVAGVIASDNVALEDGSLKMTNLTFGITTKESNEFAARDVPFDALMGLAISSLSQQRVPTYIEALAKQKLVTQPQMGYNLGSVNGVQDSEITFGGIDSSKFDGQLVEFPNQSKVGFWQGALTSATMDGKAINVAAKTAILDTGTSLIVAPAADAKAIHAAIPGSKSDGQGGYVIPCTSTAKLALTFGGQAFNMRASDLSFVPVNTNNLAGMCQSSISEGNIDQEGSWLLGDSFLKSVYFATDVATNKMGLAQTNAGK